MPTASTRTRSGARISGGPLFWLLAGMFIVPLWIMGQLLKGAILLAAWAAREISAHYARKRALAYRAEQQTRRAVAPAAPEDEVPAEPEDARPPGY